MAARIIAFPAAAPSCARVPATSFRTKVAAMWQARRTRRLLAEMDPHMLADIGIGRGDAMVEAARPFWDLASRRN